ncbi:hypothetical protein [Streptomyces sp. NPDC006879]|uniref:hypothetical protein n=1 Tax=Streptomyces sp. NPDC006879 TaxID=3364767 RepID=UPI00369331AC
MAEHDADRGESREEDGDREHKGSGTPAPPGGEAGASAPLDEEAAWAAIVAGYGQEPPDPPGARPFRSIEDLALLEEGPEERPEDPPRAEEEKPPQQKSPGADRPLGSSVAFAPGVGPRDHQLAEPSDEDFDEGDEGHFVPPEPPPLPTGDTTARFAWLAVIGGPVLLLLAVLLQWDMTWWLTTLGVGGFLGGFATLVARMQHDDEDGGPGSGAVV